MSHEGTEVAVDDTDPYAGQWEAAAATFIDDKVAIKGVLPSIRRLADWAFAHQDEFAEIADKEFLPKIKKARGHNREMLQEAYKLVGLSASSRSTSFRSSSFSPRSRSTSRALS